MGPCLPRARASARWRGFAGSEDSNLSTRDAGLIALGFMGGMLLAAVALAAALSEIERGRSIDAMLQRLASRSWVGNS